MSNCTSFQHFTIAINKHPRFNLITSFLSLITEMRSNFHETFLFLTRLCWKNRVAIPAMISVAFLVNSFNSTLIFHWLISIHRQVFNFRWQVEISIQTERIPLPVNVTHDHDESQSESDEYTSNEEYELASTTTDDDSSDDLIFC